MKRRVDRASAPPLRIAPTDERETKIERCWVTGR
jgi:hypothetical protein